MRESNTETAADGAVKGCSGTARIRTGVIGTQGRKDTKLPHGPAYVRSAAVTVKGFVWDGDLAWMGPARLAQRTRRTKRRRKRWVRPSTGRGG